MMRETLTPIQEKRQEFALRLIDVLYEMDELLIEEYNEVKDSHPHIVSDRLEEIITRKLHLGGMPFPIKINGNGTMEPNEQWVSGGYFSMNMFSELARILGKQIKRGTDRGGTNG